MTIAFAGAAAVPSEGVFCSTSCGLSKRWTCPPFDASVRNGPCGTRDSCLSSGHGWRQFNFLQTRQALWPSRIWVASDYSNSVPDSSDDITDGGYHPLEEVRVSFSAGENKPSAAEIARTTLEASKTGLLVFPGMAHHEPHDHFSWTESRCAIDEFGDIYFDISHDENILKDRETSIPVLALFGMNLSMYQSRHAGGNYNHIEKELDDASINSDYLEDFGSESEEIPEDWGMPDDSDGVHRVHPVYFSKYITKAITAECTERMDHPSNSVSIIGYLRPCDLNEEPYARRALPSDDDDDFSTECEGMSMKFVSKIISSAPISDMSSFGSRDDEFTYNSSFGSRDDEFTYNSTYYRLDIVNVDLFSVYGVQACHDVNKDDFLDAVPDALVDSASAIIERLDMRGVDCNAAVKAMCKRKGILLGEAYLIGIDSLGIDVRVLHGRKVQTHRFAFKVQAKSESTAEKQLLRLLLSKSQMKKLGASFKRELNWERYESRRRSV
ncbi:hypothetical protein AKJ16_DCAP09221 [Drosera capensis]